MECQYREGKKQCTWWVTGCINPNVDSTTKQKCTGKLPRFKTEGIKEVIL